MGHVQVERSQGIVTVTLSNPAKRNAIPVGAWPEIEAVFREVGRRRDDRCVVLTGDGDDFSSGADVTGGASDDVGHPLRAMRAISGAVEALHGLPQPVVARVSGVCVGIGLNMALACDIVVASDDARFSEIFVRRGLSIDGGGSWSLPRTVGLLRAKELALLGDIVTAAEAERMGLVTRVVPRADLDATVADLATRLAAGPPLALSMTKRLLDNSAQLTLAQIVNFGTKDTAEALLAFSERREPRFEGA
jgi:2-(1,2-epoxy-1,2-dihydrophenyl)acetyl-CoA isomerase